MLPLSSPFARQLLPVVAGACVLIFSSCASDQPAGRSTALAKISPPLAGQEVYFDGSIVADLKLGAGGRPTEGTPGSGMGGGGGSGGGGCGRGRRPIQGDGKSSPAARGAGGLF